MTSRHLRNQRKRKKFSNLTVSTEVRALAQEVLELGSYGTLTNTLAIALRTQKSVLIKAPVTPAITEQSPTPVPAVTS
jgi:hypothetical protein